jgi:hypothetical protein
MPCALGAAVGPLRKDADMSPRRTCLAPLLAVSLAMLLAACSLPGSEAPGTALTDPALTARPAEPRVAADNTQPPKTQAPKAQAPKASAAKATAAKDAAPKDAPAKGAAACAGGNGCVAQLKGLVTGADRGWIGRPQAPQQFADGTRLFAYRALRPKLSCRELSLAIGEIAVASKRLLDPASAIPQDRAQNVAALANDVAGELTSEQASRCATATGSRTSANSDTPAHSQ